VGRIQTNKQLDTKFQGRVITVENDHQRDGSLRPQEVAEVVEVDFETKKAKRKKK